MIVVSQENNYITMPKAIFEDTNVSSLAKGVYAELYITKDYQDKQNLSAIKELQDAGYLQITNNSYILLDVPVTVVEKKVDKTKNEFSNLIESYTKDDNLRIALNQYFYSRLFPEPNSRFANFNKPNKNIVKYMLKTLDDCQGDKVKIVQYCTEHQYGKFFDLTQSRFDGVVSGSYTPQRSLNEN